ncbi:hypothetical protein [Sphingomonas xanthus]|uniref:Uncharacterized protein n=1 Tax=Sphingomonas xanthus TaxID=2594473 RepID=A0A516ITY5_9SPHN|nr:hypothetical protein [Sphingomonas xanthus]QDP20383.1 hypothetical protein FMM02_10725 [Sphingomonas xanthus]
MIQPTPWRMTSLAFGVWALNFLLVYAVALVDESGVLAKWAAVGLGLVSIAAFFFIWRWAAGRDEARMVRLAVAIAAAATLFNSLIILA